MVEWDTSNLLRSIAVPSLVIHNQRNRFLRVHAGQRLAASIPNSRLLVVDDMTYEHVPRLIAEFLGLPVAPAGVGLDLPSGLVTILFTDMVGSTSMMRRLGDDKGRAVLRQHERIVREALKAHGGTEVKTMGDGFMACLSSATRALECAIAMQRAFAEHNAALLRQAQDAHTEPVEVRVRVGLNAGEPIAEDEDLFGTAVILAARIAAKAEGGEILASDVVRQLVAGKGFLFSDRGDVVLRGFEDPVRLYEVRWEA
jgi:class 3 adenylate cyclase